MRLFNFDEVVITFVRTPSYPFLEKKKFHLRVVKLPGVIVLKLWQCLYYRMLKQWIKRKKRGTKKEENKPRWEADYELVENEGLFQEYLEMSESF